MPVKHEARVTREPPDASADHPIPGLSTTTAAILTGCAVCPALSPALLTIAFWLLTVVPFWSLTVTTCQVTVPFWPLTISPRALTIVPSPQNPLKYVVFG